MHLYHTSKFYEIQNFVVHYYKIKPQTLRNKNWREFVNTTTNLGPQKFLRPHDGHRIKNPLSSTKTD